MQVNYHIIIFINHFTPFKLCLQCFDAVGWVAGIILPVKTMSGEVMAWLSVWSEMRFAYGSADATATPSYLAPIKSRMVYLSGAGLPRLSWKKAVKWM